MAKNEPFLSITLNLREGKKEIKFTTISKFKKWATEQLEFWHALLINTETPEFKAMVGIFRKTLKDTHDYDLIKHAVSKDSFAIKIKDELNNPNIKLLASSKDAFFLNTVMDESPDLLRICTQILSGNLNQGWDGDILARAYYRVGDYLERGQSRVIAPTRKALAKLEKDFNVVIEELEQATQVAISSSTAEIQNTRDATASQIRASRRICFNHQEQRNKNANESIERIHATNDHFKLEMELAAPAKYWSEKAKGHKTASENARNNLIKFLVGIVVLLTLILLIYFENLDFLENTNLPLFATVILLGLAGSLSTIAFWIGRVMTRIYLSEHHLAIDAQERSVMAKTYLALIDNDGADKEDRSLVLAALFRPTADGVVKDDAAPMWNLQSAISSAISKPN